MIIEKRGSYTRIEDLVKDAITNTNHPYIFDLKGIPEAILRAEVEGKNITIIGDYDADGICGSSIAYLGFMRMKEILKQYAENAETLPVNTRKHLEALAKKAGLTEKDLLSNDALHARIAIRIPHRYSEGYGLRDSIIDEIKSGVIFTVDNGIAAASAIQKAKDKELITILTDHHSLPVTKAMEIVDGELKEVNKYVVPNADYILNPHVEETFNDEGHYDFYDYCGAGVSLKVVEGLLGTEDPRMNSLYALAAIATVADVMPMVEDNRNIFFRGIEAMRSGDVTTGLQALLNVKRLYPQDLPSDMPAVAMFTSDTMGFTLGPLLNAPGRVGTEDPRSLGGDRGADRSVRCLLEPDKDKAKAYADELNNANEHRKEISKEMQMRCETIIAQNGMRNDCPMVVHIPECGAGVIGLVAGYLEEQYGVPSIVFNGNGGLCKGSARSPEGINIKALLDECQELIEKYGGHPGAAGLTVKEENIDKLRQKLYNICKAKGYHSVKTDTMPYDLEIGADDVKHNAEVLVKTIAPFGEKNPEPLFLVKGFEIKDDPMIIGEKHLKMPGKECTVMGFNLATDQSIKHHLETHRVIDFVGRIGFNCFRGEACPTVYIEAVVDGDEIIRDDPAEQEIEEEETK